jgi:hypothetical protein
MNHTCAVCNDPDLCARHELLYQPPVMGVTAIPIECLIEKDPAMAFLYRALIRLAERHGLTVAELLGDGDENAEQL